MINLSLSVLDHATPSFDGGSLVSTILYDYGRVDLGSAAPAFDFDIFNLASTVGSYFYISDCPMVALNTEPWCRKNGR